MKFSQYIGVPEGKTLILGSDVLMGARFLSQRI